MDIPQSLQWRPYNFLADLVSETTVLHSPGYICVYADPATISWLCLWLQWHCYILLALSVSTMTLLQSPGYTCDYNDTATLSWLYLGLQWPWYNLLAMPVTTMTLVQYPGYICVYSDTLTILWLCLFCNDTDNLQAMPVSTMTLIFSWLCQYPQWPCYNLMALPVSTITFVHSPGYMPVSTMTLPSAHRLWLSSGLEFSPAWWTLELITICVYIGCGCLLALSSHLCDGCRNSLRYVCAPGYACHYNDSAAISWLCLCLHWPCYNLLAVPVFTLTLLQPPGCACVYTDPATISWLCLCLHWPCYNLLAMPVFTPVSYTHLRAHETA